MRSTASGRFVRTLAQVIAVAWLLAVVVAFFVGLLTKEPPAPDCVGAACEPGARGIVTGFLAVPGYGIVGGLLALRRPTISIGWLLLGMASVPLLIVTVGVPVTLQNGIPLAGLALVLVLFPTGRVPSRGWWVPMGLVVGGFAGADHLGLVPLGGAFEADLGAAAALVAIAACVVAPLMRFKRSTGVVRAQLQWLGAAAGSTLLAGVVAVVGVLTGFSPLAGLGGLAATVGFGFGIPGAILVAVLRHGLYDVGRIVTRATAYAVVVIVLTLGYLVVVVGVGAIVGIWLPAGEELPVPLPLVATAAVALAFQPIRARALRLADRRVFGRKATPYQALAGVTGTTVPEVVGQIARLATEATTAGRAVVWLSNGVELRPAASHPGEAAFPTAVAFDGQEVPGTLDGGPAWSLDHHGEVLGAISVHSGSDALGEDDRRLLADLAAHSSTALRSVLESAPLPGGTVTFLMTDVQGSTRLWEENPLAMAEAIRRHDGLVREVVDAGGGVLIKWRGEGDSTFSVFTDAAAAVITAEALQEAVASQPWPTSRPLVLRAALHTGEAELRGRDYFGRTVNRCARLRALAEGGQTLVSAATRELARGRLPEDLRLRDLGERALKDLDEPEHVYELAGDPAMRFGSVAVPAGGEG